MTDIQRSNLARVALAVFKTVPGVEFNMEQFAKLANYPRVGSLNPCQLHSGEPECGTTCCIVGHGPFVLGPSDHHTWHAYSDETFGITFSGLPSSNLWDSLFSAVWPNDREQAALRILAFLEGRVQLKKYGSIDYSFRYPSDPQLEEKLQRFVLP